MKVLKKLITIIFICNIQPITGYRTLCGNSTYNFYCPQGELQIDQVIFPFIDKPCVPRVPNYCEKERQTIQSRCNGQKSCSIRPNEFINTNSCPILTRKMVSAYICNYNFLREATACGLLDNIQCSGTITGLNVRFYYEEENQCEAHVDLIKSCVNNNLQQACLYENTCDYSRVLQAWCFYKPFSINIDYRCVQKENSGDDRSVEEMGKADDYNPMQTTMSRVLTGNTTESTTDKTPVIDESDIVDGSGSKPRYTDNTGVAVITTVTSFLVLWVVVAVCILCRKRQSENKKHVENNKKADENRFYHTLDPSEIADSGIFVSEVAESGNEADHDYFNLEHEVTRQHHENNVGLALNSSKHQPSVASNHDYFVLDPVATGYLRDNDNYSKIHDSQLDLGTIVEEDESKHVYNTTTNGDYDNTKNWTNKISSADYLYDHTSGNEYDHAVHGKMREGGENPNYDRVDHH